MPLPPLSFAVLDTETTGLVPKTHRIIEYADIRMKGDEETDRLEELFAIEDTIPPHVEVLTRIRPAMLAGKPPIAEKRAAILERLTAVDLLVGQNLGFDIGMLKGEGIDLTDRPWVDTSMLASLVYPELKSYSLPYMSAVLGLDHAPAHRALGDVRATLQLFALIWERLLQLPAERCREAKEILGRTSGGYALLFDALPPSSRTEPAPWLAARERAAVEPAASAQPLAPPPAGSVTLLHETLHPDNLQTILNASAADPATCEWIAVKNLEHALARVAVPEGTRVLHPPQLLLNPDAVTELEQQASLLPDEALLLLKVRWYRPRTRFELPLHGGEKDVWNGRLACAASSPAYTQQFTTPARSYLLDHWQLLSLLREPAHPARALLTPDAHVVLDDASMLEDTATRAYGHLLNVDDLRAAAQTDDALLRLTDLLALWAERTRRAEDQHFVTSVDLDQPDTAALRRLIAEARERTDLPGRTREQLEHAAALLAETTLDEQIVWLERRMDGRLTLHGAPRHVDTLLARDLFDRFPTTLLVPPSARETLPEVVPAGRAVHTVADLLPRAPLTVTFPEPRGLLDLLRDPPPGKTVILAGSKRMIEQAFIAHAETLEARGIPLLCQGLSGGQGRMEAEFTAAPAPAVLVLTPYLYEGFDLPAGCVDHLLLESVPFDYLGHPVLGRRKDRYQNGFNDYFLPRAQFRLFRLLRTFCRHRTPGGDVAIFDRRLREKAYGKDLMAFLSSFSSVSDDAKPSATDQQPSAQRTARGTSNKKRATSPTLQQQLPL